MNEVHSPKKPLIFYYMVAMLLVMLFNFIAMPWLSQYQIQEVDYNTFVSMTEKGEIGRAEIQEADNRILFTSKDEKTIYKTAMISTDSQLVQRLLDAGVSTSGEEIEQTSLLMNILSWVAPILIFIALGQFMSRKLMQKMGGAKSMLGMLPGAGKYKISEEDVDEKQMERTKAIILSMTPGERENPSMIDSKRKRRIAAGSGTDVQDINKLLKQFDQAKQLMKQLKGSKGRMRLPF